MTDRDSTIKKVSGEGDRDEEAHADHPNECNICGVWLGFQTDRDYCESCARDDEGGAE